MAQGPYMAPPMGMMMVHNPEAKTIRTILDIVRILAIIFAVILLLGSFFLAFVATIGGAIALVFLIPLVLFLLVDLLVFMKMGEIRDLVDAGRFQEAKSRTVIWMILGFILGGVLIGVLLLIAYLKYDDAARWQQAMQMQMAGPSPMAWTPAPWGQPPAAAPMAGAPAPFPQVPSAAPGQAMCPRCGRPATWIAQYGRWYCYADQQYV